MESNQGPPGLPLDLPTLRAHFETFMGEVWDRVEMGHKEYQDRSLGLSPATLAREVKLEAVDIPGWSFMLWLKIQLNLVDRLAGVTEWQAQDGLKSLEDSGPRPGHEYGGRGRDPETHRAETQAAQERGTHVPKAQESPVDWDAFFQENVSGIPAWRSRSLVFDGMECLDVSSAGARKYRWINPPGEPVVFWIPSRTLNPGTTCTDPGTRGRIIIPSAKAVEKGLKGGWWLEERGAGR